MTAYLLFYLLIGLLWTALTFYVAQSDEETRNEVNSLQWLQMTSMVFSITCLWPLFVVDGFISNYFDHGPRDHD